MASRTITSLIAFFSLLWLISASGADAPLDSETEWMAVLLAGARAGHFRTTREVYPQRVETTEAFYLRINRGGATTVVQAQDQFVETTQGTPLAFSSSIKMSGAELQIQGEIRDGRAYVTTQSAGSVQTQEFDWPAEALLAEGSRLLALEKGFQPGTQYQTLEFIASDLKFAEASIAVEQSERVDLLGTEQDLTRVVQTLKLGNTPTTVVSWINSDGTEKKTRMNMMGSTFEAIACPEACATAETEPTQIFAASMAQSPQPLPFRIRDSEITYIIKSKDPSFPIFFPESDEQDVEAIEPGTFQVTVSRVSPQSDHSPADINSDYLQATRWLQINEPEIRRLALEARGTALTSRLIMLRLEAFVRDYVNDKNLSVGYASALEVARNRSGDCTEHALLLAALGRSLGIPTRVATGLAYVDNWLGSKHVFVPHAWTQALIDGKWISFDAALGRFDAGHIALGYGQGDPGGFYDGINTLGNISIVAAQHQ